MNAPLHPKLINLIDTLDDWIDDFDPDPYELGVVRSLQHLIMFKLGWCEWPTEVAAR